MALQHKVTAKKFLLFAGILALAFVTGLFRDDIFVTINEQIQSLGPAGSGSLILKKWLFTGLFSVVYLGWTLLLIRMILPSRINYRIAIVLFAGLTVFAFTIAAIGYVSGYQEKGYRLSRDLMGLVQSPLLMLLLIPALAGFENTKK